MLFDDVVDIYLTSSDHASKDRDCYSLERLRPHFSGRLIADIVRADVRAYLVARQGQGVMASTAKRELRFFSAAINFVSAEYSLPLSNPVLGIAFGKPEARVRWITHQQAAELVAASSLHAKTPLLPAFIRLALNTGCRKGELLGLEWSRVDFERRFFRLDAVHTKGRKRRVIPLNDDALSALQLLRDWVESTHPHSPWVFTGKMGKRFTTFKTGFTNACERVGIEDFRIHDMRHTFASWLVMAGVDLYRVRDLLGHSSITTTEIYAHLAPDHLREAVQRLPLF